MMKSWWMCWWLIDLAIKSIILGTAFSLVVDDIGFDLDARILPPKCVSVQRDAYDQLLPALRNCTQHSQSLYRDQWESTLITMGDRYHACYRAQSALDPSIIFVRVWAFVLSWTVGAYHDPVMTTVLSVLYLPIVIWSWPVGMAWTIPAISTVMFIVNALRDTIRLWRAAWEIGDSGDPTAAHTVYDFALWRCVVSLAFNQFLIDAAVRHFNTDSPYLTYWMFALAAAMLIPVSLTCYWESPPPLSVHPITPATRAHQHAE